MNIEEEVGDPFEELVKKTETSPGAPFETENLKLLSDLKKRDRSKFEDLRAKLKSAGARVSELDHLIYEDKAEDANTVDQPHWHVEPYPLTVLGSALVEAIASRIKSHVVLSDDEALVVALWVVLSWTHEAAVHSPILLITSPEKECGKSTLIGVLGFLVPKGLVIVEISPAVLFRMIEAWHPTLLVDEADDIFKNNPELRSVINSGWTRNAGVPRCNPDTHEPEFFSTFGPKVLGIKGLKIPDTTLSRSIIIEMHRKLPHEKAVDFAHTDDDGMAGLRSRLMRWAQDNKARLVGASPTMAKDFRNRLAANWRLIFAIADLCGVGEKARKAAEALSRRDDEQSMGIELLMDTKLIFDRLGVGRLKRDELIDELVKLEDRPWAAMPYDDNHGPITASAFNRILKRFHIKIKPVKFEGDLHRGVEISQFQAMWDRYAPPPPPEECNRVTFPENRQKKRNWEEEEIA